MKEQERDTAKVANWWDTNPFTYNNDLGVSKAGDAESLDIGFFDTAERKYIKHSGAAIQEAGQPVFSKFIDYSELKGKRVLDIAVGTGFSTVTFAKFGALVTGIDISEYAVRQTKRNLQLRGLQADILVMDGQDLRFPDNTFDFVCAHGCLMHMPDTQKAVTEIYRVLKPGGKVYAWMYHRGWYYWFNVVFLRGILMGKFFVYGFSPLKLTSRYSDGSHQGGNPHTKFYSRGGFRRLFSNAGFDNVEVFANFNANEWVAWPVRSLSLGKWIPMRLQKFLSTKVGFAYGCSIRAVRK